MIVLRELVGYKSRREVIKLNLVCHTLKIFHCRRWGAGCHVSGTNLELYIKMFKADLGWKKRFSPRSLMEEAVNLVEHELILKAASF